MSEWNSDPLGMKTLLLFTTLSAALAVSACHKTDSAVKVPPASPSSAAPGQETNNSQSATGPSGNTATPGSSISPPPEGQRPIPSQGSPGPTSNP